MSKTRIAPSILAADFGNLQRDIEMVNHSEADWFHLDIMDGVFVPNISYGMPIINVDQARTVFVLKRSMASGFSGVDNPLFFGENTRMLFGDAKESISGVISEFG